MIPMLLSYIDENITMSSEAVLMKNHRVQMESGLQKILPCTWQRNWWKISVKVDAEWIRKTPCKWKITLKFEVGLMKKYRVSGSGIDENYHISW